MKSPASDSEGKASSVREVLKKPENIGGWLIAEMVATPTDPLSYEGNAVLEKDINRQNKRDLPWKATYLGRGNWDLSNADRRYKDTTPFSINPINDQLIRTVLTSWLNRHKPAGALDQDSKGPASSPVPQKAPPPPAAKQKPTVAPPVSKIPLPAPRPELKPQFKRPISQLLWIPTSEIRPNRSNPRKDFNESALEDLAETFEHDGQNTPIEVVMIASGDIDPEYPKAKYELIKGERRWRTAVRTKIEMLETIIRPKSLIPDKEAQNRWCFIGDFHQKEYNKVETALFFVAEHKKGASMAELARLCGRHGRNRSSQWVADVMLLNKLHPQLLKLMNPRLSRKEQLSFTIAISLARLPMDEQLDAYEKLKKIHGFKLQIFEAQRLAAPFKSATRGRRSSPGEKARKVLVAVPRMLTDARMVDEYPDAVLRSLVENRLAETQATLTYIGEAIARLRSLEGKIKNLVKA